VTEKTSGSSCWKNISFQLYRLEKSMELYQLEYFLEAARQKGFTRAAEHLHLAQAALSEQMRKLEAELGTALFHRGRRETTLTPAGELLRQHAELLLRQAAEAKRAVADLVNLHAGRLTIGSIPSVSASRLPAAITTFRKKHPKIELRLLEGTSQTISQWVESGQVDLGIVQLPVASASLATTSWFSEGFSVLLPQRHVLAAGKPLRLRQLAEESFIFYKGRARDVVFTACVAEGFEPRVACESEELETIRSLVAVGLGIAVLPDLANRTAVKNTFIQALAEPTLRREVALLERRDAPLAPAAAEMKQLLLS
jgi:DNA-binding transcriptional LysR family regulator